jgi:hypothetical protein
MSKTSTTATEPNKPGLPDSPERGLGESAPGPAVAGTGPQGAQTEEVVAAQQGKPTNKAKKDQESESKVSGMAWFRVKGPGSVKVNGSWFGPGAELQLGRAEALSVDDCLEEIDSPS